MKIPAFAGVVTYTIVIAVTSFLCLRSYIMFLSPIESHVPVSRIVKGTFSFRGGYLLATR